MNAGHFGVAALVKSRAPCVPLWALMLASQWLDLVFVPLVALGIERFETLPGAAPGAYGELVIYADYSHSLVGALLLSGLFGALAAHRYGGRSGVVLALVAFSHWPLDWLVHRADLPLLPGNVGNWPRLGLGLWQQHAVVAALELLLVVAGALFYWQAACSVAGNERVARRRAHVCGLLALVAGCATLGLNLLGL